MPNPLTFAEVSGLLADASPAAVRFYVITRHVREGVPASRRMLDKYRYAAVRVGLDEALQAFAIHAAREQVRGASDEMPEPPAYRVIDDDLSPVSIYETEGKALPFMEVVSLLQAGTETPVLTDLADVQGSMWASCIAVEERGADPIYAFAKMSSGKVAIEYGSTAPLLSRKRVIAAFNTAESKLEIFDKPTIQIDARVHCVLAAGRFFVLQKHSFEQIIGLESDYVEHASDIVGVLEASGLVTGVELLREAVGTSRSLIKRLANIARDEGQPLLTPARMEQMRQLAEAWDLQLKCDEDSIALETPKDVELFVRLLEDYFVQSPQTGHRYGSRAKRRLPGPVSRTTTANDMGSASSVE